MLLKEVELRICPDCLVGRLIDVLGAQSARRGLRLDHADVVWRANIEGAIGVL